MTWEHVAMVLTVLVVGYAGIRLIDTWIDNKKKKTSLL